jgi:hypothetical protein
MRSGQNSARLSPDNDILAVLEVANVRSLSRQARRRQIEESAGRFKEVKVWNAHDVGLSFPRLRTSATFVGKISARRISLDGSPLLPGPTSRSPRSH